MNKLANLLGIREIAIISDFEMFLVGVKSNRDGRFDILLGPFGILIWRKQ